MRIHAFLLLSLVVVNACGGGGGDDNGGNNNPPPTPTNAGGVWEGSTFSDQSGETYDTIGVITENNGEARFVNEQGQQFVLTGISGTNGNLAATITAIAPAGITFIDGSTVTTGTFDGTVVGRDSLEGDWSLNTGESGTVTMSYNNIYGRDSDLLKTAGSWMDRFGVVYTVDGAGEILAQDASGCIFSGAIDVINSAYNVYQVTLTVSNCPGANTTYSGVGVLTDNTGTDDAFVVQMDDGEWIFTEILSRL